MDPRKGSMFCTPYFRPEQKKIDNPFLTVGHGSKLSIPSSSGAKHRAILILLEVRLHF